MATTTAREDAGRIGLANGALARISSKAGSVTAPVEVSEEMMPGVVCLPHGWGHDKPGARLSVASRHAGAGTVETAIPGVAITVARQTTPPAIGMFEPRFCLVLQGAKEVTIGERRMRYEPNRLVAYPVVHFVAGDKEIDAVVFPIDGIRQSPASPVDGRPMRRADAAELESLLAESG